MGEVILSNEVERAGLAHTVAVDSAGTGDWHIGEPMDSGARAELKRRGYDGSGHQARQIDRSWLGGYDLILAMDRTNLANLRRMAGGDEELQSRIRLMRSFDPDSPDGAAVPDPYNGQPEDYAEVFELVHAAARGLAERLASEL